MSRRFGRRGDPVVVVVENVMHSERGGSSAYRTGATQPVFPIERQGRRSEVLSGRPFVVLNWFAELNRLAPVKK